MTPIDFYKYSFFQILKEGDFTEIHEQLGKEVLPEEYGGTNGKLQDHLGNFCQIHFVSL